MKKVLMVFFCIGFILCLSECISAQRKSLRDFPTDTAALQLKIPQKQIRKHDTQMKKTERQTVQPLKPEFWKNDRPLLMKEKDTLKNKAK
jgi:hypothetical protein